MPRRSLSVALLVAWGWCAFAGIAGATTTDPAAVVAAFEQNYNAGDEAGLLALVADDAVIRTVPPVPGVPGTLRGISQIRRFTAQELAAHGHDTIVGGFHAVGERVTWSVAGTSDVYRQIGLDSLSAGVEATVRNGKITSLTYTFSPEAVAKLRALAARLPSAPAQLPAAMPSTGGGGARRSPR